MPHFCTVVGCSSEAGRKGKGEQIGFYRFPKKSKDRREQWVSALKRTNEDGSIWTPKEHSRICSLHFVTRKPSRDSSHSDYVPTIFPNGHSKPLKKTKKSRHERPLERKVRVTKNLKDKHTRQNIVGNNGLISKKEQLEAEKNILWKKKLTAEKRYRLIEEEWNTKYGPKDVACQTKSGLYDFIVGDCLNFSCLREGNNVTCEVLSPGFFNQDQLITLDTGIAWCEV